MSEKELPSLLEAGAGSWERAKSQETTEYSLRKSGHQTVPIPEKEACGEILGKPH